MHLYTKQITYCTIFLLFVVVTAPILGAMSHSETISHHCVTVLSLAGGSFFLLHFGASIFYMKTYMFSFGVTKYTTEQPVGYLFTVLCWLIPGLIFFGAGISSLLHPL